MAHTIKTADASGAVLNWLVAKALGKSLETSYHRWFRGMAGHAGWSSGRIDQHLAGIPDHPFMRDQQGNAVPVPGYASDPGLSVPLMEADGIATRKHSDGTWYAMLSSDLGDSQGARWRKTKPGERYGVLSYQVRDLPCCFTGPTQVIASLRCIAATRLGQTAEVPDTLLPDRHPVGDQDPSPKERQRG